MGWLAWLFRWGRNAPAEWAFAESLCIHDLAISGDTIIGLSLSSDTVSDLSLSGDTVTAFASEEC